LFGSLSVTWNDWDFSAFSFRVGATVSVSFHSPTGCFFPRDRTSSRVDQYTGRKITFQSIGEVAVIRVEPTGLGEEIDRLAAHEKLVFDFVQPRVVTLGFDERTALDAASVFLERQRLLRLNKRS
jgi:hypothetical protein